MRFGDLVSIFFSSILLIAGCFIFGAIAINIFLAMVFDLDPEKIMGPVFVIWGILCGFGIPVLVYQSRKAEMHCDACELDWSLKKDGQTTISEKERTEVVQKFGEGQSNKRRIVTTRVYWQHYTCANCGNETKTQNTETNHSAEF